MVLCGSSIASMASLLLCAHVDVDCVDRRLDIFVLSVCTRRVERFFFTL
jgi:hypothetical protein